MQARLAKTQIKSLSPLRLLPRVTKQQQKPESQQDEESSRKNRTDQEKSLTKEVDTLYKVGWQHSHILYILHVITQCAISELTCSLLNSNKRTL